MLELEWKMRKREGLRRLKRKKRIRIWDWLWETGREKKGNGGRTWNPVKLAPSQFFTFSPQRMCQNWKAPKEFHAKFAFGNNIFVGRHEYLLFIICLFIALISTNNKNAIHGMHSFRIFQSSFCSTLWHTFMCQRKKSPKAWLREFQTPNWILCLSVSLHMLCPLSYSNN